MSQVMKTRSEVDERELVGLFLLRHMMGTIIAMEGDLEVFFLLLTI